MRARTPRWLLGGLLLLIAVCPGCVWLQNEFFVYDVAPPASDDADAAEHAAH